MCVCVCVRVCVCVCVCVCARVHFILHLSLLLWHWCVRQCFYDIKLTVAGTCTFVRHHLSKFNGNFICLSKLNQDCCEHHFQVHFFKAHCSLPFQFVLILFCSSPASSFERWIQLRCQRKFVRIQHSLFSNEQSEHGSVRKRQREHWQDGDCEFWCCKKSKTQKAQMREVS